MNIKADDLDKSKLTLMSLGSLAGISVGLLLSLLLSSTFWILVIGVLLLTLSLVNIFKNIYLLM